MTDLGLLVRYKLVRGTRDFTGVVNRTQARSKYGGRYYYYFVSRTEADLRNKQLKSQSSSPEFHRIYIPTRSLCSWTYAIS